MNPDSARLTTEGTEDTEPSKSFTVRPLRSEIRPAAESKNSDPEKYELGDFGIISLKKAGNKLNEELLQQLIENQHDDEDARVLAIASGEA